MSELNPTGISPVGLRVLVRVDKLDDRSAGGLYIPESVQDRQQIAHDRGTLVAVSEMSFGDFVGQIPQIGDQVIFNKYAGSVIHFDAKDGRREQYRLCEDKDVCAIIEEGG